MGSLATDTPSPPNMDAMLPTPWISTPVIESAPLSQSAGCRIFLKLENLQPSGSFKSRGIGNLIRQTLLSHPRPDRVHFYSSSGGNAGLACVTAARKLGRPATVVVPLSTKALMIAKIETAGASEVVQVGETWKEADEYLRRELLFRRREVEDGVYVPPFDHEDVWAGNAGVVLELEEKPDVIVASVGGGGLFCGIMQGLEARGWGAGDVDVLAVETEGAASLAKSLEARQLVTLEEITTMATSLGARRVAERAFQYGRERNVKSVVLSDGEAAMGCWRLADEERLLVEPACGVSAALCWDGRLKKVLPKLKPESKVVIVICGGSNVTLETLVDYRQKFGIESSSPAE